MLKAPSQPTMPDIADINRLLLKIKNFENITHIYIRYQSFILQRPAEHADGAIISTFEKS